MKDLRCGGGHIVCFGHDLELLVLVLWIPLGLEFEETGYGV